MAKSGKNTEVIRWLHRYIDARKITQELWNEMQVLQVPNQLKSPVIGETSKGSGTSRGLERFLIVDEYRQKMYSEAHKKEEQAYKEVSEAINGIGKEEYICVLRYRYILDWDWSRIADEMGYAEDYAKGKLHGKALEALKRTQKVTFICDNV